MAVVDEKKCSDLGEGIISDLGLANFDFDVPDEILANIETPTNAAVLNVKNSRTECLIIIACK